MGARATNPTVAPSRRLEAAVQRCAARQRVVLAVSGGRDSMALLHAASRVRRPDAMLVATFDHGTGAVATRAADLVAAEAGRLGLPVVIGRASHDAGTEAGWRSARQAFLSDAASAFGGAVMTAHTRDDQVETVLMRVLRDAGARGLAGLYAGGSALRPLLGFSRDEVAGYAHLAGARFVEDPTNASAAFLRNRVRRDLLPALRRVAPDLDAALLDASRRAAELRLAVDAWVGRIARVAPDGSRVAIDAALRTHDPAVIAMLWPAIAARVGLAMDRRGTVRAAAFTRAGKVGAWIPLSGGWVIARARDRFDLRRALVAGATDAELVPGLAWQEWRFVADSDVAALASAKAPAGSADGWVAMLPAHAPLRVRAWRPGDRMCVAGQERRVKRFLSDAAITGEQRARWPVVLSGDEIVWIPGVRRSDAAAVRPGRPGVLYRCDCYR